MEKNAIEYTVGTPGVVEVPGFECSGVAADIRGKGDERPDLALFFSEVPCAAAGVFTRNELKAAPVRVCLEYLGAGGRFHGVVVNSGNANCCTGEQGLADARLMAELAAGFLAKPVGTVLVCSTGKIGRFLPMGKVAQGIERAVAAKDASAVSGYRSLEAILTSDSGPKSVTARFWWQGRRVTLSAVAKGGGMIHPNMATVITLMVTDACVEGDLLQRVLRKAALKSFNSISVDGDMSTNDTALLLANGLSGVVIPDDEGHPLYGLFVAAVAEVCCIVAEKVVNDGKHTTKVVEVNVEGASCDADAERIARSIGNSVSVKMHWFRNNAHWGSIVSAAGQAGVYVLEDRLDLAFHTRCLPAVLVSAEGGESDEVEWAPVLEEGRVLWENRERWEKVVDRRQFGVTLDLHLGKGSYRFLAADLSDGYIRLSKKD